MSAFGLKASDRIIPVFFPFRLPNLVWFLCSSRRSYADCSLCVFYVIFGAKPTRHGFLLLQICFFAKFFRFSKNKPSVCTHAQGRLLPVVGKLISLIVNPNRRTGHCWTHFPFISLLSILLLSFEQRENSFPKRSENQFNYRMIFNCVHLFGSRL